MDVHAPHEPVHTWKDFVLHIVIVTIGLFIALMLEAVVEYGHHRHLVREARENIHQELEDNHQAAQKNILYIGQSAERVQAGLKTMRFMQTHPKAQGQSINFNWEFETLNDAAWRSARDTGALGFMPYKAVQAYAQLYGTQASVSEQMAHIVTRGAENLAPILAAGEDFTSIPANQYSDMLRGTAASYLDVLILQQYTRGLDQQYMQQLK